jgi:hypothetical protein
VFILDVWRRCFTSARVNGRGCSKGVDGPPKRISEVGTLRLDIPVDHCTLSLLYPTSYRGLRASLTSPSV